MSRRKVGISPARNPWKESRVDQLLAIVEAFVGVGRPIPGHILRELVQLQPHWGKRKIPTAAVAAREVLHR